MGRGVPLPPAQNYVPSANHLFRPYNSDLDHKASAFNSMGAFWRQQPFSVLISFMTHNRFLRRAHWASQDKAWPDALADARKPIQACPWLTDRTSKQYRRGRQLGESFHNRGSDAKSFARSRRLGPPSNMVMSSGGPKFSQGIPRGPEKYKLSSTY